MKANELMLGDWVYGLYPDGSRYKPPFRISAVDTYPSNKSPRIVTEGGYGFQEEHLVPIPLTAEILEKNGFIQSKQGRGIKPWALSKSTMYVSWVHNRLNLRVRINPSKPMNALQIDCPYVHTLQHALRLCGIEKEIVL